MTEVTEIGASGSSVSDAGSSRLIDITEIREERTTLTPAGCALRTTTPTLLVLLSDQGVLESHGLSLVRGDVVLLSIPGEYQLSATEQPVKTAVASIRFTINNLDASDVLPRTPFRFDKVESNELCTEIVSLSEVLDSASGACAAAHRLSIGYRLLNILFRVLEVDKARLVEAGQDPDFQTVLAYIKTHFQQPLTIEDIARECMMSVRALYRLTSRVAGTTPMRLVKKIRLEHSLELLKEDLKIEQVARRVGFLEANHFSREFKRAFGITAMQCKQQHQIGVEAIELLTSADSKFEQKDYRRAATLYERLLKTIPAWTNVDQVYYRAGLCRHKIGDSGKRNEHWSRMTSIRFQLRAKLHLCVTGFARGRHAEVVGMLREIYDDGSGPVREEAAAQAVGFLNQCAIAQKFAAARQYAPFCKACAHDNPSTHAVLASALVLIGDYMDVLRLCPQEVEGCAQAMRSAGLYKEHLDRFPEMRSRSARIYLRMGRGDVVLAEFADQPDMCVRALIQQGRHQEAIDRYPQHSAPALLAAGRYQQVLDQHPASDEYCMWALALQGKQQQALGRHGINQDQRANLLLFLESVDELVNSDLHESMYKMSGTMIHGIHLLEKGRRARALETLHSLKDVDDPEYRLGILQTDLLIPLIDFLFPQESREFSHSPWTDWRGHYRSIVANHRYLHAQQLWYSVRFILNEIDESEYHTQPWRRFSTQDVIFLKGMKADYRHAQSEAADHYEEYLEKTSPTNSIYFFYKLSLPVERAFARWRSRELRANASPEIQ